MSLTFNLCVVIPCYNHGDGMRQVLSRLQAFQFPCIIVDDGSDEDTRQVLEQLSQHYSKVTLVRLSQNAGKGAAVIRGLYEAQQAGFSHVLQVDADGQHNIEDIPQLVTMSQKYPDALISGQPVYDDSIPAIRRWGRWITHIWVWIETLSWQLKDSMCGFRIYPVDPVLRLASRVRLGQRMDFDTDIMVRLYWQGTTSHFVPTRVIYPQGGISHFNALKDNYYISLMHSRLFFGMLPRIFSLLSRHVPRHWAQQKEVRGLWGMRIMLAVWRIFGRRGFSLLLYPVVAVYWLLARDARRASQNWLIRVRHELTIRQRPVPAGLNSYRHFLRFAHSMLDKIAGWRGELSLGQHLVFASGALEALASDTPQGKFLLASHLGDLEACRALGQLEGGKTINALVFNENALRFKQIMDETVPQAGINLIPVTDIGPETIFMLKEKLDRGEWIAIVGDRIAVNPQRGGGWRVIWSNFMGSPAPFPQGSFILASVLRCPVLLVFTLHQQGRLNLHCEPFADPLLLPRTNRQQELQHIVDCYAQRLEHYALLSPLDWFNFFDFWRLPALPEKE